MNLIRVAILGEIGSRNMGDDLGYILLRNELMEQIQGFGRECQVEYLSSAHLSKLDHQGYDAVATGCGTLLDRREGAYVRALDRLQQRGTMTAILGSGMSDEHHLPPTDDGATLFERVKSQAYIGWVRGHEVPDPFWLMGWRGDRAEPSAKIGINMGFAAYTNEAIDRIWARLKMVHDRFLVNHPVEAVSCWTTDEAWLKGLSSEIVRVGVDRSSLDHLKELRAIVSFRGHLGVAAACYGAAVFPVVFSSKIPDMYMKTGVVYTSLNPQEKGDWFEIVNEGINNPKNNADAVKTAQKEVKDMVTRFSKELVKRVP